LHKNQHKIKKADSELTIQLKKTPDSLAWAGKNKKVGQTVVGFAMETQDLIPNARKKLKSKPCDFIVANTIGTESGGFASDQNTIVIISENREQHFSGLKSDIAYSILKHILE
jgi:phosphopantothenoylcysteine decarboxylase/phosphopantothenate--cysteine ligase